MATIRKTNVIGPPVRFVAQAARGAAGGTSGKTSQEFPTARPHD